METAILVHLSPMLTLDVYSIPILLSTLLSSQVYSQLQRIQTGHLETYPLHPPPTTALWYCPRHVSEESRQGWLSARTDS